LLDGSARPRCRKDAGADDDQWHVPDRVLFAYWTPISITDFVLMASTGLFDGIAQFALLRARRAPVSVLALFEYSSLICVSFWGLPRHNVFFGAGRCCQAWLS
jgi:hypothetical protein